jgi:hypothetical protein
VDRRKGKLTTNETDALQKKVKNLESIITMLSLGSDDEARELLKTMRENRAPPASGRALPVTDVLSEWHRSRERDVEYNAEVSSHDVSPTSRGP